MEVIINSEGSSINCEIWILEIFGASLSEPNAHKWYSCARNICPAWLYGYELKIFYCAFSFLGHRSQLSKMQIYTR